MSNQSVWKKEISLRRRRPAAETETVVPEVVAQQAVAPQAVAPEAVGAVDGPAAEKQSIWKKEIRPRATERQPQLPDAPAETHAGDSIWRRQIRFRKLAPAARRPDAPLSETSVQKPSWPTPKHDFWNGPPARHEASSSQVAPPVTEPAAVEAPVVEAPFAEPVAAEPEVAEPEVIEPVVVEPAVSEPVVSEPVAHTPVAFEPAPYEPAPYKPVTYEPMTYEPLTYELVSSEPVSSQPVSSEPMVNEPVPSEPFAPGSLVPPVEELDLTATWPLPERELFTIRERAVPPAPPSEAFTAPMSEPAAVPPIPPIARPAAESALGFSDQPPPNDTSDQGFTFRALPAEDSFGHTVGPSEPAAATPPGILPVARPESASWLDAELEAQNTSPEEGFTFSPRPEPAETDDEANAIPSIEAETEPESIWSSSPPVEPEPIDALETSLPASEPAPETTLWGRPLSEIEAVASVDAAGVPPSFEYIPEEQDAEPWSPLPYPEVAAEPSPFELGPFELSPSEPDPAEPGNDLSTEEEPDQEWGHVEETTPAPSIRGQVGVESFAETASVPPATEPEPAESSWSLPAEPVEPAELATVEPLLFEVSEPETFEPAFETETFELQPRELQPGELQPLEVQPLEGRPEDVDAEQIDLAVESREEEPAAAPPGNSRRTKAAKTTTVVGLRIGSSQIVAAIVRNGSGSPELVQVVRKPLASGIIVAGEVREPEALATALKALFAEYKLPRRGVRLGIASNRIGVRTLEVPANRDPRAFENSIRFRAQELLSIPITDAILDHIVLGDVVTPEGPGHRVLLAFAHRELIDRYLEACKRARIKLLGIDFDAFALLRAVAEPPAAGTAPDRASVAVAIGNERTIFAVAEGDVCDYTRVLEWGGGSLDVGLARALHLTPSQAEPLKLGLSFDAEHVGDELSPVQVEAARAAMRTELQVLARELLASLQYYQSRPESLAIGEILLTGGAAELPGIATELERLLGVPVRSADPYRRLQSPKKDEHPAGAGWASIAIGLGMEA